MSPRERALFELQVQAFLEGVSELVPEAEDYGLGAEDAQEIVDRAVAA